MSRQPQDLPPGPGRPPRPGIPRPDQGWPRWAVWVLVGLLIAVVVLPYVFSSSAKKEIDYSEFKSKAVAGQVDSVVIANQSGNISGKLKNGDEFTAHGPEQVPDADLQMLQDKGVKVTFKNPGSNIVG